MLEVLWIFFFLNETLLLGILGVTVAEVQVAEVHGFANADLLAVLCSQLALEWGPDVRIDADLHEDGIFWGARMGWMDWVRWVGRPSC